MANELTVLLTGTGTIGGELLLGFVRRKRHRVFLLVRGKGKRTADERARLLFEKLELNDAEIGRVVVLAGDVAEPNLGLSGQSLARLTYELDVVVHTAAVTELTADRVLCERVNVGGTKNAIALAEAFVNAGRLRRFVHLSTAFACGQRTSGGPVLEDELSSEATHLNFYEKSKFEAEKLVREEMQRGLPATIFRPSMVAGGAATGWVRNFNVIYPLARIFSGGHLRTFPADPQGFLHFAPIDLVVKAISDSLGNDWTAGLTFHLTGPAPPPTVSDFFACEGFFPKSESKPRIFRPEEFDWDLLTSRERELLDSITFCLPYFNSRTVFDTSNAKQLIDMPRLGTDYLDLLARYARQSGYLHGSPQEAGAAGRNSH